MLMHELKPTKGWKGKMKEQESCGNFGISYAHPFQERCQQRVPSHPLSQENTSVLAQGLSYHEHIQGKGGERQGGEKQIYSSAQEESPCHTAQSRPMSVTNKLLLSLLVAEQTNKLPTQCPALKFLYLLAFLPYPHSKTLVTKHRLFFQNLPIFKPNIYINIDIAQSNETL